VLWGVLSVVANIYPLVTSFLAGLRPTDSDGSCRCSGACMRRSAFSCCSRHGTPRASQLDLRSPHGRVSCTAAVMVLMAYNFHPTRRAAGRRGRDRPARPCLLFVLALGRRRLWPPPDVVDVAA